MPRPDEPAERIPDPSTSDKPHQLATATCEMAHWTRHAQPARRGGRKPRTPTGWRNEPPTLHWMSRADGRPPPQGTKPAHARTTMGFSLRANWLQLPLSTKSVGSEGTIVAPRGFWGDCKEVGRPDAVCLRFQNHLEERLLDQAHARASYTPPFWGHSRSIPQGMIFDVQPLVKSLFCPIRPPPMDFLILRPLSPKTGQHFFEGVGWGGGGSKVFAQKAPSSGEADRYQTTAGGMVTQPTQSFRSAVRTLVG